MKLNNYKSLRKCSKVNSLDQLKNKFKYNEKFYSFTKNC